MLTQIWPTCRRKYYHLSWENVESGAVEKGIDLVDLEKYYKMSICSQKSASIRTRMSPSNILLYLLIPRFRSTNIINKAPNLQTRVRSVALVFTTHNHQQITYNTGKSFTASAVKRYWFTGTGIAETRSDAFESESRLIFQLFSGSTRSAHVCPTPNVIFTEQFVENVSRKLRCCVKIAVFRNQLNEMFSECNEIAYYTSKFAAQKIYLSVIYR